MFQSRDLQKIPGPTKFGSIFNLNILLAILADILYVSHYQNLKNDYHGSSSHKLEIDPNLVMLGVCYKFLFYCVEKFPKFKAKNWPFTKKVTLQITNELHQWSM